MTKERIPLLKTTNKKRLANAYYSKKRYIHAAIAAEIITVLFALSFLGVLAFNAMSGAIGFILWLGIAMAIDKRRRGDVKELDAIRARYRELKAEYDSK